MEKRRSLESRLDSRISLGFRIGSWVSGAFFVAGLILIIATGGQNIKPQIPLNQIPAAIVSTIGILLLLLTPISLIILAIILFSISRNRLFIGISVALLCFAALSLAFALT
jgi:uncharacterized membrane protein